MIIQSGVATFFGLPMGDIRDLSRARCAIAGIPWDEGNAGRNGANYGPRAFRDASSWFFSYDAQRDIDLWEQLPKWTLAMFLWYRRTPSGPCKRYLLTSNKSELKERSPYRSVATTRSQSAPHEERRRPSTAWAT